MPTCKDCEHSIFCDSWGEWKCTKYSIKVYSVLTSCPGFEKRTTKMKPCHCEACLEKGEDDA